MDASNLSKQVLELATPHRVLSSQDVSKAAKLCEVVKQYLTNKAKSVVAAASGRAVLFSYGSDGTPMLTRACFKSTLGGHTVRRYAGKSVEFLVERGFVKTSDGVGEPIVASLARDPVPLLHGKTAWHMFPPACAFFPLLQRLGHAGIAVSHYCFDRAVFDPLMEKLRQRHAMYHAVQRQNPASDWTPVQECLDWVVGTPCANHDCQNALKWSLKAVLDEEDTAQVVHALHIAIASVRNGFDLLHAHLGAFVGETLDFWEGDQETPEDTSYQFWLCLGVDAEIAQILAGLNLFWSGDKLRVARRCREDPMLLEKITHCILHVCRFKQFTDSRWITVGDSSRSLLAAMCLGLGGWVRYTRKDPRASDFYLHGFTHLQPRVLLYCAVGALASPVCDAVLMELLDDDRLAKRAGEIMEIMGNEIQWLAGGINNHTWVRLASVVGACPPARLRHITVVAACTIGAFLHKRLFSAALSLPWRLASGDILANLDRLASEEQPVEPTAAKIHRLLRLGYNRHALALGVERMADARWTTTVQEQGHGSGAAMRKAHSTYSQETIAVRAMLHMVRPLFQEPSLNPKLAQAERKIARLGQKSPNKVSARQAFFSDLVAAAKEGAKSAGPPAQSWYRDLMRKHGRLFEALPRAEKELYEARAADMRRASEEALQEEVAHVMAQQRLTRERLSEEAVQKKQMLLVSSCRLSQEDFEAVAVMYNSPSFSKPAVAAMREKAQVAPVPPSPELQAQLAAFPGRAPCKQVPTAEWCKEVCRHREHFKGCAIVTVNGNDEGQTAFLFLMAFQRPFWAAFVPMFPVHHALPAMPAQCPSFSQSLSELPSFQFEAVIGEVVFDSAVFAQSQADLHVLPHCLVLEGGRVVSNGSLCPFGEFVENLGPPPAPPKQQGTAPEQDVENPAPEPTDPKLDISYAWLRQYAAEDSQEPENSVSEPSASSSPPPAKQPSYLSEEEVQEAFALLEAKRAEWRRELSTTPENFKTSIAGGAWSMASKGLAADSVKAAASGSAAKDWRRRYGFPQAASFAYKKYTEKVATALALYWCQRLQYFFDLSKALPEGYAYTEGDVQGAPGVEEVSRLLEDVVRTSPDWLRWEQKAAEIQGLAPKSPKGKRGRDAASSSGR
jgi:hypothetical protein